MNITLKINSTTTVLVKENNNNRPVYEIRQGEYIVEVKYDTCGNRTVKYPDCSVTYQINGLGIFSIRKLPSETPQFYVNKPFGKPLTTFSSYNFCKNKNYFKEIFKYLQETLVNNANV